MTESIGCRCDEELTRALGGWTGRETGDPRLDVYPLRGCLWCGVLLFEGATSSLRDAVPWLLGFSTS